MPQISDPKRLPAARTQFSVTFEGKEVAIAEELALRRLGSDVVLPGFRPGKAPADVLRSKLRAEDMLEETVRSLVSPLVRSLPAEHKLRLILPPKVEVEKTAPLTVLLTFVERPEVKVKGGKITVEKKEPQVDPKDVDRMVAYLLQQYRTFTEVEREAKENDRVTIDFHGADADGKEIQQIRTQGYSVTIGSKTLIPGFEDALKGQKKGGEKSFTLTFPAEYHAEELRGKPVTFHAKVTKVEEVKTPEFSDAFVKEHHLGAGAEELRKNMEASMRSQEEESEKRRRESALFDAIAAATAVELAPELLEQTERGLFEEMEESITREGTTLQDWMEHTKRTPQTLQKELRTQAEKRLKLRFGVEELLQEKRIATTDAELDTLLTRDLERMAPEEQQRVRKEYAKGSEGYEQLRWRRNVEKLVEEMLKT